MESIHPLISVIVPVYKVEPYLRRCVDSILCQTYPHLEVILVDDGSPDHCGAICEEYAQADSRVFVIHRENGGLSAARNSGLDFCHGEYIGFVDSDDYILPDMYEQLLDDVTRHHTLLAFCHTDVIRKGKSDGKHYGTGSEMKPKEYVMERALKESIWWSACTKLYHRSLFDKIRYPEGKTNEDLPVTLRIYDRCNHIVVNYNKLYCYYIRESSITTSGLNPRKFDILDNASDVASYLHLTHPDMEPSAVGILLSNALGLLIRLRHHPSTGWEPQLQKIRTILRQHWPSLLHNPYLSHSQKALLTAARLHPKVLDLCLKIRTKHSCRP